jgi:hypothetical protein
MIANSCHQDGDGYFFDNTVTFSNVKAGKNTTNSLVFPDMAIWSACCNVVNFK